ncbi:MAG: protein translocase subunit SecF [Candidatus Hydrogenedentota bacterium]|nr:MAG: protein translocase subunit SecF [Candidatus Hydrogenedentota bacterium]
MIPFMKFKWFSLTLSILVFAGTFYYTETHFGGFKKGLDFAGGIKIEIRLTKDITIEKLREFFKKMQVDAIVQQAGKDGNDAKIEIGNEDAIKLDKEAEKHRSELEKEGFSINSIDYIKYKMLHTLGKEHPEELDFVDASKVGPTVGKYLRESAVKLLLVALALITAYVAFRFQLKYAAGATLALLHDLALTLGFIGYFQIPLSIPVVAALLTILGYSINDTIVVYDRIRENLGNKDEVYLDKVVDRSINESLSRTIITSLTTLISVVAVYFYGGEGLNDMAAVLIIGIIIGTYSSSFIASPVVVIWNRIAYRS